MGQATLTDTAPVRTVVLLPVGRGRCLDRGGVLALADPTFVAGLEGAPGVSGPDPWPSGEGPLGCHTGLFHRGPRGPVPESLSFLQGLHTRVPKRHQSPRERPL